MLASSFEIQLGATVLPGLCCVGKYDGKSPSFTAAISGGKVLVHASQEQDKKTGKNAVRMLNLNKQITALNCGNIDPLRKRVDILLVGTKTNLLAYDVEFNSDIFYRDVPDGVSAMAVGMLEGRRYPSVIVGGNCAIQGYDVDGEEVYWSVTGDNVSALAFCDVDGDGQSELIVGSDDFEIKIYQNEEVISQTSETDSVCNLIPMYLTVYGYGLTNGTIGVYDRSQRLWRVKSKNRLTALSSFDIDGDGVPELISGWANGNFEVRNDRSGDLVYKDSFTSPVSCVLPCDYRLDGREVVLVCSKMGKLRGYEASKNNTAQVHLAEEAKATSNVQKLMSQKQKLQMELDAVTSQNDMLEAQLVTEQENAKAVGRNGRSKSGKHHHHKSRHKVSRTSGSESDCRTIVHSRQNLDSGFLEFTATSKSPDVYYKGAVVFAFDGGVFEGESIVVMLPVPSQSITVQILPKRNVQCTLSMQLLLAGRTGAEQFNVLEIPLKIAKFCVYAYQPDMDENEFPESYAQFELDTIHASDFLLWIQDAFSVKGVTYEKYGDDFTIPFISLRDKTKVLVFSRKSIAKGSNLAIYTIHYPDMDFVGELIQHLASIVGLTTLACTAKFEKEMNDFKKTLELVDDYNAIRLKLTAEMADNSGMVKNLVIKAEDARILGNMKLMRKMYNELFTANGELLREFMKRSTNHQNLLQVLKKVNLMIQNAAKLRVGQPKIDVVRECREAVKAGNVKKLFKLIGGGDLDMDRDVGIRENKKEKKRKKKTKKKNR